MLLKKVTSLLMMLGLAACQSVQPPSTASGRPEVTIANAQPGQVKAALLSGMLDKGYRLVKDDTFSVTLEKPIDNFAANLLLSTPAGGSPIARLSYTVAEIGSDVRVVADMALIQNAGMAFERRTDVSRGADSPVVQGYLDKVAVETSGKGVFGKSVVHR